MNCSRVLWLALLWSAALCACSPGEAFVSVDSSGSSSEAGDVEAALSALPSPRVLQLGASGAPSFVVGNLGHAGSASDLSLAQSRDFQAQLRRIAPVFRLTGTDLEPRETTRDSLGLTHVRLAQRKDGLRVVGGELTLHLDGNGVVYAAHGNAHGDGTLSAVPALSEPEALAQALASSSGIADLAVAPRSELVFYVSEAGAMALAWETQVTGNKNGLPVRDSVYIDAHGGTVLARHAHVHTAQNRTLYSALNFYELPGTNVRGEGEPATNDSVVNTNYDLLGSTWSCYHDLFGRDSYDNKGAELVSTVHYGSNYVNAFWTGSQMVYGDGDEHYSTNLAISMDVTAHELTHAVTEHSADLTYSGESGGLNESMSDVFGGVCEAFRAGGVSENTWKVGEDIWTPKTAGDALRYMDDPTKDGASIDHYSNYYSGLDVHYSSGLGNLAFYLASQGGTHPHRSSVAVPAITIEKAQQIWYRALTVYMNSNTNFLNARLAMEQSARDLYSADEVAAVGKAWAAVGVGEAGPGPGPGPGPREDTVLVNNEYAKRLAGARGSASYFVLDVPAGVSKLTFSTMGGEGDADLYVKFGSRPTTASFDCRPFKAGNDELCKFKQPAAGKWYVMLGSESGYSGVFLKGKY